MPNEKNKNENKEDFSVTFASDVELDGEDFAVLTSEEQAINWMRDAMKSFDPSNRQYSSFLKEGSSTNETLTTDELKRLALNAQNDLHKILKINSYVGQVINEDDIIGKVYESIVANLNTSIRLSFDALPQKYKKGLKDKAKNLIKKFHKETNIEYHLATSIPGTYTKGTYIKYLRSKNGHYVVDQYPLGVAIISDYSLNGKPYVLIDIRELQNRLQKTVIRGKKNKPLFFGNLTEEIKNNYPPEVYNAFVNKERYAKLDIQRTGVNRFCNMGGKYGITPIFKALKSNIMLDTLDETDKVNAKAKAKKIIHQILRKELLGPDGKIKALDEMAYAHENLMKAFKNPTVLYTSPAFVEKIVYVEPKVESTDVETKNDYRSRVTSTLGISFLNTDGNQTVSTANISIKQLMKTINKIAENEEKILEQWYCLILEENGIPVEYCPTPHILDAELLEFEMKKDLAEFLYSKLNCSYQTAYGIFDIDVKDEVEKRIQEKELGYEDTLSIHPTSYNSSGDTNGESGRPSGSDDPKKQEYDENYNQTRAKS